MNTNIENLEKELWDSANNLRANSELKSSEYSYPVLGIIFLKYADYKFSILENEFKNKDNKKFKKIGKDDYLASGAIYLNGKARFKYLLELPENENTGLKINESVDLIEKDNPDLKDILPKIYTKMDNVLLVELLRTIDKIPMNIEGDAFGRIYEYFLNKFALSEGQKGGEFFTPTSIVKLIIEIIEPNHGRIYDPACGSGGMFVQSTNFIKKNNLSKKNHISIFGQERVLDTVRLNKMNLAVHGLAGDIRQGNCYYDDLHESLNKFDFVIANPPFNVKKVNKEKIKDDKRYPFGMPTADNANYIWIQMFYSSMNEQGRAGFVMANSALDARGNELTIRKKLIEENVIDIIISIGTNFFYSVTLPCTLWFFDKNRNISERKNNILFIDAREIFTPISKAHNEFNGQQIEFLSNIVKLYRGQNITNFFDSENLTYKYFPEKKFKNVNDLCKSVPIEEIVQRKYNLNPGLYIDLKLKEINKEEIVNELSNQIKQIDELNNDNRILEKELSFNIKKYLESS